MIDSVSSSDPDRHPVDVVAEEFAARCRKGERPSVNEYARLHPDLADELREMLPPIALMERLKFRNLASSSGRMAQSIVLDRLGDFRIVREVGRGGMGIVYEAQQESLGRHVALKVLSRASLLDPQRVERFEREARAAAALHHTNIVPVFGVGQADGLHFIVMQFINGRTLGDVVRQLAGSGATPGKPSLRASGDAPSGAAAQNGASSPSLEPAEIPTGRAYWRWVAAVGRQAADALDYAHRQGVVHRDVKPGNLLLDERGAVWVTDFGLAKNGEVGNVTRSGDVIGTLQYLAPEGLAAQTDARGDVYGLAATLYELLALKPAFDESNPAALMRRIAESEPLPPRKLNPHVPPDLETIVMKGMSRQPSARYQTAGDFAADLGNFLHDRPITARRASLLEHGWRWCRRNRAVASLSALAAGAAIAAIVLGWRGYSVTRAALAAEASRNSQIEAARQRADQNVALSLAGFQDIFNQLAPRGERPPPGPWREPHAPDDLGGGHGGGAVASAKRESALLQSILSFYDRFAKQNPTNDALQAEAAKAYRRVGDSYLRLGQESAADTSFRKAAAMYTDLLGSAPDSANYRLGLAEAVTWLGSSKTALSAEDAALVERAATLAESITNSTAADPDDRDTIARVLLRDGERLLQAGKLPSAEIRFRQSAAAWRSGGGGGGPPPLPPSGDFGPRGRSSERYLALIGLADVASQTPGRTDAHALRQDALAAIEQSMHGPGDMTSRLTPALARLAKIATAAGDTALATEATAASQQVRQFDQHGPPRRPDHGDDGNGPPPIDDGGGPGSGPGGGGRQGGPGGPGGPGARGVHPLGQQGH